MRLSFSLLVAVVLATTVMMVVSCDITPLKPLEPPKDGDQPSTTVEISGKITNYSSGWKPFATKDNTTYIYGSVEQSGEPRGYSIQVPRGWGSATVGIYKDANNNNQIDSGEERVTKQVVVENENITVHFELPLLLTISGKLTGSPTQSWKVGVTKGFPVPEYAYGYVNTSTWEYTISLPSNTYVQFVFAFRDDDNDNTYDVGEPLSRNTNYENFHLVTNISGVNIEVQSLTNMTLRIVISNNVYGLNIGVATYNVIGTYQMTTPSTNLTSVHTLTIEGNAGNNVFIGIYYDNNGNNKLDFTNFGQLIVFQDGFSELSNIYFAPGTNDLYFTLVPHTIAGTVEWINGASGLKPIALKSTSGDWPNIPMEIINYGSISGNSYTVKFYTPESGNNLYLIPSMFKDVNNNSLYELQEPIVYWYQSHSNIVVSPSLSSTNTANMHILRTLVDLAFSGTDANYFRFVEGGLLGMIFNIYRNLPLDDYELYSDTNTSNPIQLMIFKDQNGNNKLDIDFSQGSGGLLPTSDDIYGFVMDTISNQTSLNVSATLIRIRVNNIISNIGALASYPSPRVIGTGIVSFTPMGGMISTKPVIVSTTNVAVDIYSAVQTFGFAMVRLESGNYEIATNAQGQNVVYFIGISSDIITNITWYVTN